MNIKLLVVLVVIIAVLLIIDKLSLSSKDKLLKQGYLIDQAGLEADLTATSRTKNDTEAMLLVLTMLYQEALAIEQASADSSVERRTLIERCRALQKKIDACVKEYPADKMDPKLVKHVSQFLEYTKKLNSYHIDDLTMQENSDVAEHIDKTTDAYDHKPDVQNYKKMQWRSAHEIIMLSPTYATKK